MFDGGYDATSWKEGFRDFMRSTRMVKEDTIESYVGDIENVAAKLGKRCEELAGSSERLKETLKSVDAVVEWSDKTKSNYTTAVNRLNAYLMSRGRASEGHAPCEDTFPSKTSGVSGAPDSNVASRPGKGGLGNMGNEAALLAQINEIEKMAREHEDKTWNSVFKCVSAYALGMPSVVIALGVNMWGCALVVLSVACAFGGMAALIPVLQRPSRQLKEIQDYGERLHFEGNQFGCIRPVEWTVKAKRSVALSAIALVVSVLFLGLAKVAGS